MSDPKRRILIVEDTDALRIITRKTLEKAGYETAEASNGEEGLRTLSMYDDIGVVLLDIMMPKMDGLEFLERSKDLKSEQGFKVCMLTAKGQGEDVKKCLVQGADDYIIKPMDNDLLLEKVKILLEGFGSYEFASIAAKLDGKILRLNSAIDITVTSLSECELTFSSPMEIPVDAKIQIESERLKHIFEISGPLILRVYKSVREGKNFTCRASFIGLKEDNYKKIRAVTTKGEALNE